MARWSEHLGNFIRLAGDEDNEQVLDTFFITRNYIPSNEEEKKEFEDFSLITSCMGLLIHIAKADKIMHPEERTRIIEDLTFQLEQRHFEYDSLKEKFGFSDREIITNIYNRMLADYEKGNLDLDKIIAVIDLVYQNNPEKRHYILRLCYYCALSDSNYDDEEEKTIRKIAGKLKISEAERARIEKEVRIEMKEY
ncbi:MAG: hypothetical protein APR54_04775 [Candidatus Cloacimonas sp. SDB]|nr:MAG: hypothetical protein APR54_04775 [Candidatus Cloacimonas sp. SDB]